MSSNATELRELEGTIIFCFDDYCYTWSLSSPKRKVYGDTVGNTGNFVLIDYDLQRAYLSSTIEGCFEMWLRRRVRTKPIKLLATDVKYADE